MEKVKQFFKKSFAYIVWLLLIGVIIVMHYNDKRLKNENTELGKEVKRNEQLTQVYLDRNNALIPKIDSLVRENSNLLNQMNEIAKKDKNIIIKYNDKVKVINKFAISDMQSYFDANFSTAESRSFR